MKPQKSRSKCHSNVVTKNVAVNIAAFFVACLTIVSGYGVRADTIKGVEEAIISFATVIEVQEDRSAQITETITYDFGSSPRHGIFRDIPYRYAGAGLVRDEIPLTDFQVSVDGSSVPFRISKSDGEVHIKIGDPDVVVSGVHEYVIRYRARDALGSFEGYDEIYWNATGNGWTVPIYAATARVILPRDIPPPQARLSCYYGQVGSQDTCTPDLSLFSRTFQEFDFMAPVPLLPGDGMTVAVGFPKGLVHERTVVSIARTSTLPWWPFLFPIVVVCYVLWRWYRFGRDPKGRGVIVPEYEVPQQLTPFEMAALMQQQVTAAIVPAEIIHLAVLGYIRIERRDEKLFGLIPKTEYVLFEIKPADTSLSHAEHELLAVLFAAGRRSSHEHALREVTLSELQKARLEGKMSPIKKAVFASLIAQGVYAQEPSVVSRRYTVIGVVVFVVGIFCAAIFDAALYALVYGGAAVVAFVCAWFMPKVTFEGAFLKERVLGLKHYLQIAEKDRLAFHHVPEKRPEVFEALLPYAMVLGVEKAWAKEFEGMYVNNPSWYGGVPGQVFSASAFTNDMRHFVAATSMVVSPHSRSGSGGGGFSGGGGGGGGGGSW